MHCKCVHGPGRRARTRGGALLSHRARADAHHHLICSTAKEADRAVCACAQRCAGAKRRAAAPAARACQVDEVPQRPSARAEPADPAVPRPRARERGTSLPGTARRLWPPQQQLSNPAPRRTGRTQEKRPGLPGRPVSFLSCPGPRFPVPCPTSAPPPRLTPRPASSASCPSWTPRQPCSCSRAACSRRTREWRARRRRRRVAQSSRSACSRPGG